MSRGASGLVIFISGVLAEFALVASCGEAPNVQLGPSSAAAQLNCTRYETAFFDAENELGVPTKVPEGWTPFAISASSNLVVVRCAQ